MEKQHESYEVGRYTNETKQEKHAQFSQRKFEHTLAQEYGKIKLIETEARSLGPIQAGIKHTLFRLSVNWSRA